MIKFRQVFLLLSTIIIMSSENAMFEFLLKQLKNSCVELKKNQKLLEENPSNGPIQPGERDYKMPVEASKRDVKSKARDLQKKLINVRTNSSLERKEMERWDNFNKTIFNKWKDYDLCSSCDLLH